MALKDNEGNIVYASVNDERCLSGELVPYGKGKKMNYDFSEYQRKAISKAQKGKVSVVTEEGIKRISIEEYKEGGYQYAFVFSGEANGMFNKSHTTETKKKVSDMRRSAPVFCCSYCDRNIKGKMNILQHERSCPKNPDRKPISPKRTKNAIDVV